MKMSAIDRQFSSFVVSAAGMVVSNIEVVSFDCNMPQRIIRGGSEKVPG